MFVHKVLVGAVNVVINYTGRVDMAQIKPATTTLMRSLALLPALVSTNRINK